jgi:hypothetical protein
MKTPWSKTPNANAYVTEYCLLNTAIPYKVSPISVRRHSEDIMNAQDILNLERSLTVLSGNSRRRAIQKLLNRTERSTKPVTQLSKAFVSSGALSECEWTTTSCEYGRRNSLNRPASGHHLSTANLVVAEHPHLSDMRRPVPSTENISTAYMDLRRVDCVVPSTA